MITNKQDFVVASTEMWKEYGELPASDHREGDMWMVEYFNKAGESIDRTGHMTEEKAEKAAAESIGQNLNEKYADLESRYAGGPGSLVDETYDDPAEYDPYDESMDGDFDSAMASAGYGTDEDYGYYGGDE